MEPTTPSLRGFNRLQKISTSLMAVLVLLTFIGSNLHAFLWQSSEWLVSTILPAVVIDLTNEERADLNTAPLQRNAVLDEAARLKAQHMAKHEYFSHYSPDGVSPWHWFKEAGYVYAHAGENLAVYFTDSDEVVDAWMDSPTHRANIVNGQYTEIGVGTAKGTYEGYKTVYVVQLFGAPAALPTPAPAPAELAVREVAAEPAPVVEPTPVVPTPPEPIPEPVVPEPVIPAPVASEPVVTETVPPTASELATTPLRAAEVEVQSVTVADDMVTVSTPVISTSSGLAVARITTPVDGGHAGATAAKIATQPNTLLQFTYMALGLLVVLLLSISAALEMRRLRFVQVAYSFGLLVVMGGLWYVHALLTTGAVIA